MVLLEPGFVFSEGFVPAPDFAVPKAQLLVNGLIEAQAWFLGWLRDGTRSHELLAVIDCFEVQTRRKNEVAPPLVYSMELPKLKAALEAGIRDENRETVVRCLALFVAASLEDGSPAAAAGVIVVPPTPLLRLVVSLLQMSLLGEGNFFFSLRF
jgi:hypothetical protein